MFSADLQAKVSDYVNSFSCYYCKQVPQNNALVTKCGHICCKNCLLETFRKAGPRATRLRCCGKANALRYADYFDEDEKHDEGQFAYLNCLLAAASDLKRVLLKPPPPVSAAPSPVATNVVSVSTKTAAKPSPSAIVAEKPTPKSRVCSGLRRTSSIARALPLPVIEPIVEANEREEEVSSSKKDVRGAVKNVAVSVKKLDAASVGHKQKTTSESEAQSTKDGEISSKSGGADPYEYNSQQVRLEEGDDAKTGHGRGKQAAATSRRSVSASSNATKRKSDAPAMPTMKMSGPKSRRTKKDSTTSDDANVAASDANDQGNVKSVRFSHDAEVREFGNSQTQSQSQPAAGNAPADPAAPAAAHSSASSGSSLSATTEWSHTFDSETDSMRFVVSRQQQQSASSLKNLDTCSPKETRKSLKGLAVQRPSESDSTLCASTSRKSSRSDAVAFAAPCGRFAKAPLDEPMISEADALTKSISPPNGDRTTSLNEPMSSTPSLNTAIVANSSSGSNSRSNLSNLRGAKPPVVEAGTMTTKAAYRNAALSPIRQRADVALSPIRFGKDPLSTPPRPKVTVATCQTSPILLLAALENVKEKEPPLPSVPVGVAESPARLACNADESSRDGPIMAMSDDDSESFIVSQTPTQTNANYMEDNYAMHSAEIEQPAAKFVGSQDGNTNGTDYVEMVNNICSNSNSQFLTANSNSNSQFAAGRGIGTQPQPAQPVPEDTSAMVDATESYVDATSRYESATLLELEDSSNLPKDATNAVAAQAAAISSQASDMSISQPTALPQPAVIACLDVVVNPKPKEIRPIEIEVEDEKSDSDLETLNRELPDLQRDLAAVRQDLKGKTSASQNVGSKAASSAVRPRVPDHAFSQPSGSTSSLSSSKSEVAAAARLQPQRIVIVASTLSAEEKSWLTKFKETFGGKVEIEISSQFLVDQTTHVLMGTPELYDDDEYRVQRLADLVLGVDVKSLTERVCMRTFKFLLGIAAGCWVLNANWLRHSVETATIADEREFEIVCDVELLHDSASCNDSAMSNVSTTFDEGQFIESLKGRVEAPRRAREAKARSNNSRLFDNSRFQRTVFTFSAAHTCTSEELATLIERAGLQYTKFDLIVSVVRDRNLTGVPLLETLGCESIIGLLDAAASRQSLPNNSQLERNRQSAKFRQLKVPQEFLRLVNIDWLIDAVATYTNEIPLDAFTDLTE